MISGCCKAQISKNSICAECRQAVKFCYKDDNEEIIFNSNKHLLLIFKKNTQRLLLNYEKRAELEPKKQLYYEKIITGMKNMLEKGI